MKNSPIISDLRQLCCLGLGGVVIVPAFLKKLRPLVESNSSSFLWVDPPDQPGDNFKPTGLYTDLPAIETIVAPRYLTNYCDTPRESKVCLLFSKVLYSRHIDDTAEHNLKARQRSGMEEEVFHPMDAYHGVRAPVYLQDETYGKIFLFRSKREPVFSTRDHDRLARVLPFLAHAMYRPEMDTEKDFTASGESGLFIVDSKGKLLHACHNAKRILRLATEDQISGDIASRLLNPQLPVELSTIYRRLRGLFKNTETQPPVFKKRNHWGSFIFRAYFLNGAPENPDIDLIGVTVEHHIPLKLKRWEQISALPISTKQKEAALLLAEGLKQAQIAERMGIRLSTAIDYIRETYAKLNIHSRDELLACMGATAGKLGEIAE